MSVAQPAHVLMVDDNPTFMLTMSALLEEAGYVVSQAESLASARALLVAAEFAAVLLDVHLGDGDGPDLIPEIKRAYPAAVVLVLSGSATRRPGGDPDGGFAGFFDKSGDPNLVLGCLETSLARLRR